jgi:L-cysteine S-thiosulfotransferase
MSRRRRLAAAVVALLLALPPASAEIPEAERRSGYHDMGASVQAIQDDDSANPAMLWVADGETLWAPPASPAPTATAIRAGWPASPSAIRLSSKGRTAR